MPIRNTTRPGDWIYVCKAAQHAAPRETMPLELFEKLTRGRGPQKTPTKEAVSLRLDRDVVEHYRAKGPGWQTEINKVLRESAKAEAETVRVRSGVRRAK
jgi:uncharacterized protein (DUF4415 family)